MIRLRALGQCVVEVGEHHVTPESDVLFALLLFLASSAGHPVSREELLELLWPDCPPDRARHRLRQALYQLKKLGAPLNTPDVYVAVREDDVVTDYSLYNSARTTPGIVADLVATDVLPNYAPSLSNQFAHWVERERDRVQGLLRQFYLEALAAHRARCEHESVVRLARLCLRLDPLNTEATIALAESLAIQGNRTEAFEVIDAFASERQFDNEAVRLCTKLRRRIADSVAGLVRPSARRESPLVGRGPILAEINKWIATGAVESIVLGLVGDAGIGKTRLIAEAIRYARVNGIRCLEYRPNPNGADRALAGLLDVLPALLRMSGAAGCSPESYRRLTELARATPSDNSVPTDNTDSAFRLAFLRRSVLDLVEAIVAEGDVLFALDDAHSLDLPSLEILVEATRCIGHRFALILGARPTGASWLFLERRAGARMIRVPRLNVVDSRSVLGHELSRNSTEILAASVDWAVEVANGNPFFLVEIAAHCGAEGRGDTPPESLQFLLDRRVESLTPNALLVLQSCAVLGDQSTLGRLDEILAIPPYQMASALSELEAAGLIGLTNRRVSCRHELIADAVFRSIGPALGKYLHRRCAALLDDELGDSPSASLAWDCATHWDEADEPGRALHVTGLIVDQLLSLGLAKEAQDLCRRSERYCRTPEQHADRLLKLSQAQHVLFEWQGVLESLAERRIQLSIAGRYERYSDDEIEQLEARWWHRWDPRVLRPAVRRALDQRAPALHRLKMAVLGLIVADNRGRKSDAERLIHVVGTIDLTTPREEMERAKAELIYHTAFGSLDRALVFGKRLTDAERVAGNSSALLKALRWQSVSARFVNDKHQAVSLALEAYERASRLSLRGEMWNAASYLLFTALDFEDIALASKWISVLGELKQDTTVPAFRLCDYQYTVARVELMRGNLDLTRQALAQAQGLKETITPVRGEYALLAIDVMLTVKAGAKPVRPSVMRRLYQLYLMSRDAGVYDFEAAAVAAALQYAGQLGKARELVADHLRTRRSRIPFPTLSAIQSALSE